MEFATEHDRLYRDVKRRAEGGSLPYTPLCGVQPRSVRSALEDYKGGGEIRKTGPGTRTGVFVEFGGVCPRSIPVRPRLRPRRGLKWRVGSRVFNLAGKACRAWLHPRARRPLPPDLPRFRVA